MFCVSCPRGTTLLPLHNLCHDIVETAVGQDFLSSGARCSPRAAVNRKSKYYRAFRSTKRTTTWNTFLLALNSDPRQGLTRLLRKICAAFLWTSCAFSDLSLPSKCFLATCLGRSRCQPQVTIISYLPPQAHPPLGVAIELVRQLEMVTVRDPTLAVYVQYVHVATYRAQI